MQILFRVDSSIDIGSGHVMRCLTLADELRDMGYNIRFVCRELPGNLASLIEDKGYVVCLLHWQDSNSEFNWSKDVSETIKSAKIEKTEIDLLVVDHYQIDIRWESKIRGYTKKIMVIDDLADRNHDCDILLDQNYYKNLVSRYDGLVPNETIKLLGPQFSLLRPQFHHARKFLRERSGEINNILIFMGGGDPLNLTSVAIKAVKLIEKEINIRVVIGAKNPHHLEIEALCANLQNTEFYVQVDNMAELIVWADLAIGAGGATTWERCYLGLPSITLVFAENQLETTVDLASIGVTNFLGWAHECSVTDIASAVQDAIDKPENVKKMGEELMALMMEEPYLVSGTISTFL